MKKMMVLIALIGVNTTGSYAQKETYICTEKIVHNKEIPIIDVEPTTGSNIYYFQDTEVRTITLVPDGKLVTALAPRESCYKYNDKGMAVTKCPVTVYKSDGKNVYEYNTEGAYLGYYPVKPDLTMDVVDDNMTCVKVIPHAEPKHTVNRWTIPANADNKDCPPR
jgi:hypothetical protein